MDANLQQKCRKQILKYKRTKDIKIRDALFAEMRPFLMQWTNAALRSARRYEPEPFVISLTWDLFEKGVDTYKRHYHVPKHFSFQADILIKSVKEKEKKAKRRIFSLEDMPVETEFSYERSPEVTRGFTLMKEFKQYIPDPYKLVFEDALLSMDAPLKYKQNRIKQSGLSAGRYYESKRVFRWMIVFLLGRDGFKK